MIDSWRQYHGNGANQGMMPVLTSIALKPKWIADIGSVGCASPVISQEGCIYIGTLQGELIALNSDGSIKWRRATTTPENPDYPGMITGSPAIGYDGNIYVVSTVSATIEDRRSNVLRPVQMRRSSLHSFTPAGNRRWSYRFPVNPVHKGLGGYTNSSPKVWGDQNTFIFVPSICSSKITTIEILVINQSGNLINKTEIACYPQLLTENSNEKTMDLPEPTLAIIDVEHNAHQPTIIIEDNHKTLAAYRWNFPILTSLWSNQSSMLRQRTTPTVALNTHLLFGSKDGLVCCYDLKNGDEICHPWTTVNDAIKGSPVSRDGQVYVAAGNGLFALDSRFNITHQYRLSGKCLCSVALSANYLYVSTTDGFYTLSLDLNEVNKNDKVIGGASSPVIGVDGTVYVVSQDGKLWAFGE